MLESELILTWSLYQKSSVPGGRGGRAATPDADLSGEWAWGGGGGGQEKEKAVASDSHAFTIMNQKLLLPLCPQAPVMS